MQKKTILDELFIKEVIRLNSLQLLIDTIQLPNLPKQLVILFKSSHAFSSFASFYHYG